MSASSLTHLRTAGVFKRQETMREAYIDQILATWHRMTGGVEEEERGKLHQFCSDQ